MRHAWRPPGAVLAVSRADGWCAATEIGIFVAANQAGLGKFLHMQQLPVAAYPSRAATNATVTDTAMCSV